MSKKTQVDGELSTDSLLYMMNNINLYRVSLFSLVMISLAGASNSLAAEGGIKLSCGSSTTLKKFSSSDNSVTYSCEKKVTKEKYEDAEIADYKYAYKQCDHGYTIDVEGKSQDECNAKSGGGADTVALCALGHWRFAVSKEGSPTGNGFDRCYKSCPVGRGYFKMSVTDSSDVKDVTHGDTVNLNNYKIVCGAGKKKVTEHTQPSQEVVVVVD